MNNKRIKHNTHDTVLILDYSSDNPSYSYSFLQKYNILVKLSTNGVYAICCTK